MKKFIRISCITAAAMLIVGFIMTTIAVAIGAPAQLVAMAKEGAFTVNGINLAGDHLDYDYPTDFNSAQEIFQGNINNTEVVEGNQITALDLSIVCGKLTIQPTTSSYIGIESSNANGFQYYQEGSTFHVKGFKKALASFSNEITLYLPEDQKFDTVKLSLGAGDTDIRSLLAATVTADIGAGDLTCEKMTADQLSVDVGAGDCTIENSTIQNADFSVGMGDTDFEGTITSSLKLDCAMGSATIQLDDSFEDHNYKLSCSLGSITMDDRSYENIATDVHIDNNSDSTYDIDCSMGDVTFTFANEIN